MSRSVEQRMADVRHVLAAAARLRARPRVSDWAESTGLSPEGVQLALDRHLEVEASDDALRALVRVAGDAPLVHVILSANVFVGALRAIALARAAAPRVVVRPSSREPLFARALVSAIDDAAVVCVDALDAAAVEQGEIHVYGRDETIAQIRARAKVPVRGHGAGMGIAIVAGDLGRAADELAEDVVPFDQRGCLSPRIAFVAGDALAFARELHRALSRSHVPRGALSTEERAEARRYAESMRFAGELLEGPQHLVGVARGLTLPPPGRHVHVVPLATDPGDARRGDGAGGDLGLGAFERSVVAVGMAEDAMDLRCLAPPHARISRLGAMQRPPLDGPVDRRLF